MSKFNGIDLEPSELMTKDEVLFELEDRGANYDRLSDILTENGYHENLWFHWPHQEDGNTGAYIFPVQEGLLYIPCSGTTTDAPWERFCLADAILLGATAVDEMCERTMAYAKCFCDAMKEGKEIFDLS